MVGDSFRQILLRREAGYIKIYITIIPTGGETDGSIE